MQCLVMVITVGNVSQDQKPCRTKTQKYSRQSPPTNHKPSLCFIFYSVFSLSCYRGLKKSTGGSNGCLLLLVPLMYVYLHLHARYDTRQALLPLDLLFFTGYQLWLKLSPSYITFHCVDLASWLPL
jgi:hypothetical protein